MYHALFCLWARRIQNCTSNHNGETGGVLRSGSEEGVIVELGQGEVGTGVRTGHSFRFTRKLRRMGVGVR